jgi:hypothetical protein
MANAAFRSMSSQPQQEFPAHRTEDRQILSRSPCSNNPFSMISSRMILPTQSGPGAMLFLGMTNDGISIQINLYEPDTCPVLAIGDSNSGTTKLLQNMAMAAEGIHAASNVRFGIIGSHPESWLEVESNPGSLGYWPVRHDSTSQFIRGLVEWAKMPFHGQQVVILFIDDLDSVIHTSREVQEDIKWLLTNGGKYQVWTIASLDVSNAISVHPWLNLFKTQIFGYIHQPCLSRVNALDFPIDHEKPVPGQEFDIKKDGDWLRFWLPAPTT